MLKLNVLVSKNNKFILKNNSKESDKSIKRWIFLLKLDEPEIIKEMFNPIHYYNWIDKSDVVDLNILKKSLKKMCSFIAFNGEISSDVAFEIRLNKFLFNSKNSQLNKHGTIGEIILAIIFNNMTFNGENIELRKTFFDLSSSHTDTRTSIDIMFFTSNFLVVNESKFYKDEFPFKKIQSEFLNQNKFCRIKNILRDDADNSKLSIFNMETQEKYDNIVFSLGTIDPRIDFSDDDWLYVKCVCNKEQCKLDNDHKKNNEICEYINYFFSFSISINSKEEFLKKIFEMADFYYKELKKEDFDLIKEFSIEIPYEQHSNCKENNDDINRKIDLQRREILENNFDENRNNILLEYDNNFYDMNDYLNKDIKKWYEFCSNYDIKERKIKHINSEKYFFSKQYEIYVELLKNGKYLLQAPTSFGKTMIVKEIIFNRKDFKKILFIVPTIALKIELTKDLKNIFSGRYKIINNSISDRIPDFDFIFIGTQEKIHEIKWVNDIEFDFVIIDEAHSLNQHNIDNERCYLLNKIFKKILTKNKNILLLSPLLGTISNQTKINLKKNNFTIFRQYFSTMSYRLKKFNKEKWINQVNQLILNKEKTLVYIIQPGQHHKYAQQFVVENFDYDIEVIDYLNDLIAENWYVTEMLKKGVLIINGRMPNIIKEWMLNKYNNDSKYNILLSNDSIVYGVNTPTQNIFIKSKPEIGKNIINIINLIGRAGRFGYLKQIPNIYTEYKKEEIINSEDKFEFTIDCFENDMEYPNLVKNFNEENDYNEKINKLAQKHNYKISKIKNIYLELSKMINNSEKEIKLFDLLIFLKKNICVFKNESVHLLIDLTKRKEIISLKNLIFSQNKKQVVDLDVCIDSCIEFYYNSFPYKIMPGIRIILDIVDILDKELNTNKKNIKKVQKIGNIVLDKYNILYFNTPKNLNNDKKEKYESICSSLRELGYLSDEIPDLSVYLLHKIPNNYGNYDIENILLKSDLKSRNPFRKK